MMASEKEINILKGIKIILFLLIRVELLSSLVKAVGSHTHLCMKPDQNIAGRTLFEYK
jgi:hypothetical protein